MHQESARRFRNDVSLNQIQIACRHYQEMRAANVTENLAIRTLELFVDVYAKVHSGGTPAPHHVSQVRQWSTKARELKKRKPHAKPKDHFRVEHGTPKRELARLVFDLHQEKKLNSQNLNKLIKRYWKLAVITLDEDRRLNNIARKKMYNSPDDRWAAAKILF
jgi:hypothetical protein